MSIGRSIRNAGVAAAALALVLAAGSAAARAQNVPSAPAKVAVVDYHRVLFEYRRQTDLREELTAFTEKLQKDLDAAQQAIRKLETEAGLLEARNPRRQELEEQIIQKRAELAVQERMARLEQQDKMVAIRTDLYNDIAFQVGAVARAKGYDLVLRVVKDDPAGEMGFGVMHFADAIDITGEVIERLNRNYKPAP